MLEDIQNLNKYEPMNKSSYEYSQFYSLLNEPTLDDLTVFIRVYGRELINKKWEPRNWPNRIQSLIKNLSLISIIMKSEGAYLRWRENNKGSRSMFAHK